MLRINCLISTPSIKPALMDVVEYVGFKILEGGNKADLPKVYNMMRKLGIEVDMQTVSHIYEEVFDTSDEEMFSTPEEVEDLREQTFRNLVTKQVSAKKSEIGKDNPSVSVASSIAGMFQDVGKRSKSAQKQLEEGLRKAAKRILDKNKESFPKDAIEKESIEQIIDRVLRMESKQNMTVNDVEGKMNTAIELFDQFKQDVDTLAKQTTEDTLGAEKIKQFASIIQDASYDLFMSQKEISSVINQALTDAGFTKDLKDAEGNKRTVVDWNKVISSGVDFKQTLSDALEAKGFTKTEISKITPTLEREFNDLKGEKIKAKLNPKEQEAKVVVPVSDIDKLIGLNNMGVFENENKTQLFKLLGVSDLDIKAQKAVQKIINMVNNLNPAYKNSPTVVKSLNRQIEIQLNKIQDKDLRLKIATAVARYSQFMNGLLITNVGNVIENTTSGLMQLIMTAATNPKAALNNLRSALDVAIDIIQGGVREGVNYSDAFSANLNISDEFNLETAKTVKEKVLAYANILTRGFLESIDSSVKNATTNIMFANVMEKTLVAQGIDPSDAQTIINATLYGNNAEVEKLATEFTKALEGAGVDITFDKTKTKRIANELARANILTNGQFFQDTIEELIAKKQIQSKSRGVKIDEKMIEGVLNAAEATAGKGLGHVSDNKLFEKIFDNPTRRRTKALKEARKSGDKGEISKAVWASTTNSMLNRYVGGAARWTWLTFEKVSGLALLQTLITDVAFPKGTIDLSNKKINKELMGKYLQFEKLSKNFDLEYKDGKPVREDGKSQAQADIEQYLSLKERLKREIIGPIVGYTIASALLPIIARLLGFGFDDDDTPEEKAEKSVKLAVWLNQPQQANIKSAMNKLSNVQLMNYYNSLAKTDKYGNAFAIDEEAMKEGNPQNDLLKTAFNLNVLNSMFIDNFNRGTEFNMYKDVIDENDKKAGDVKKVLLKYALELSNLNTPFKYYDINKNIINGLRQQERPKMPQPKDLKDVFMKTQFNRDAYLNYMENKADE